MTAREDFSGPAPSPAEVARLERELAHFRALVEMTSDWAWEVDARGRYTYSSPKVRELLGYEPAEVVGRTPFDFMPPDEATRVAGQFAAIVEQRREFHELVNVNRHREGHLVVLESSGVPIFDDLGAFRGFRGIDRDVTSRVHDEQRLRLMAAAVKATAEGIVVADASGNITAVNPTFEAMTGFTEAELVGKAPAMLTTADGPARDRLWDLISLAPRWRGEGLCRHRSGDGFDVWLTLSVVHDERGLVSGYVALVGDLTERRAAEATIRFQATHDALTQLANRGTFLKALDQAITEGRRTAERSAVLFIDLDGFKPVNDRYGHGAGDMLLSSAARRLERVVRRTDLAARFGGDEFTILLRGVTSLAVPLRVARECVTALSEPFRVGGLELEVGASVGIAHFPDDAQSVDALVAAADRAMYEAKRAGGRQVCVAGDAPESVPLAVSPADAAFPDSRSRS